jgi:hypothetical protein
MRISKGFAAAILGLGVTLLAWFGSWEWPAWPAFTVLHLFFPRGGFGDISFRLRSAVVVALMIVNVSFWGVLAWLLMYMPSLIARSRKRGVEGRDPRISE